MATLDLLSIGKLLSGDGLASISKKVRSSPAKVAKVLSAGIPVLLANMKRNVATQEGEASLGRALQDHSGKDTDNVVAFLKDVDTKDGKKILGHVLGDDQDRTAQEISRASGLSAGTVIKILAMIAPLLLSLLGNQQQSQQTVQQPAAQTAAPLQLLGGAQQTQTASSGLGGLGLASLLGSVLGSGTQQQTQAAAPAAASNPALSLLGALLSDQGQDQPQQESASDGLLSGFLNLFR